MFRNNCLGNIINESVHKYSEKRNSFKSINKIFMEKENKKYKVIKRCLYIKIQKYITTYKNIYIYTLRNAYNIVIGIYYVKN